VTSPPALIRSAGGSWAHTGSWAASLLPLAPHEEDAYWILGAMSRRFSEASKTRSAWL
jgi:hypothetical protein